MKRRILTYRKHIDSLLESEGQSDWKYIKQEHLTQLAFFQHERLVHHYLLENEVQKMYVQYDMIVQKVYEEEKNVRCQSY